MGRSLNSPWTHYASAIEKAVEEHSLVSVTDASGTITYVNAKFEQVSGYSAAELIGQNHRLVKSTEQGDAFWREVWCTISSGKPWSGLVCNRNKNGELYWVETRIIPLLDAQGMIEGYFAIRTNVTDLVLARNQANAAVESKSRFFANMSHELRTPMNAVLGMVRLLKHTPLNLQQADYASKAENSAVGLLGILDDILDFSKLEVDKILLEERPFSVEDVMVEISTLMAAIMRSNPVEVLFDISSELPAQLRGDSLRIKQVLTNLGSNAVKFTRQGNVVFKVCCTSLEETHATLEFSVSDSGIGIAPEHQQAIFSPFSQAEVSTTRRFGGTGLGLSISRRLVEMMGGQLQLDSELGAGSKFYFSLRMPLVKPNAAAPALKQGAPSGANGKSLSDMQVLVVDDNPVARNLISAMLRNQLVQVETAASGEKALQMVMQRLASGQRPFDAVFLDWQMPGMDGWDTARALKKIPMGVHRPPRLIMVSASGRENLAEKGREEQAMLSGFLAKPVSVSMLLSALTEEVSEARQQVAPESLPGIQRPLEGMRILVVEDNALNQQIARELLAMQGAEITLASNGQQAVDVISVTRPEFDVVLMDLQMPVLDGFGATRKIRHDLQLRDLIIIAVSANATDSDRTESIAAGMTDHIGKPFDIRDLTSLIVRLTRWSVAPAHGLIVQTAAALPSPVARYSETIEVEQAVEWLGGDNDFYCNFVESYLEDLALSLPALKVALDQLNFGDATRAMHTIKGLSKTVGATRLAEYAAKYEAAFKHGASPDAPEQVMQQLQLMADQTVAELKRVLAKMAGSA